MSTHITIDGKIKHRYNSEGELIHSTEEGIHNFYKWFGDSTATDNQGRPKVFYHGTDAKFDTFKPQPGKTSTIFGVEDVERQGHFFTPSLDFAKEYTKSGNVMKVYLKMHKPFDMRNGITSDMYDTMDKHGINPKWLISNHIDDWERFDGEDGKHFKEALHNSGHDSAIIFEPHGKEAREAHIVFHSNQIKSATDNEGNFDMSKESINESLQHPMIDVDGEMKHRHNSEGNPIHHTDEGIRNFHRWFGNSKVVDEHGRPLVVYHGTTHGKFQVFNTNNTDGDTDDFNSSIGAHFTESKAIADRFAKGIYGKGKNPHLHEVYLKIETPLTQHGKKIITPEHVRIDTERFNSENKAYNAKHDEYQNNNKMSLDDMAKLIDDHGIDYALEYQNKMNDLPKPMPPKPPISRNPISEYELVEKSGISYDNMVNFSPKKRKEYGTKVKNNLISDGHDGVLYRNAVEKEGWGIPTWIAFHPKQIKSATDNEGNFDMSKESINESLEHPMIDVDGEMKHRHNSNGAPIHHTDEGIRNFHRWFDKSKAVDEHGRPQVFYHGTTHNFKSFDTSKSGQKDHGWYGVGHYFTPDVYTASAYSTYDKNKTNGANVMPVYLKLHNPYKWTKDIPIKKTSEESMEATMNMRNNGNDGVFVENEYATTGHEKFYEAVVFHPRQIKSAIGNQGNFDISKDSINESVEFPEEAIVGRLKEMRDSGRYKVTHKEYNSKYDQHEFHVNALPSTNAVFYHHQKGRPDQSWYNPDMTDLHTPYPEDQFSRTYPKLKTNIGYTPDINEQRTPGVLYRGMSHEEFKNIKSTGQIKSHGDYNLEGQEGLTYYSRDPDQAAHYAHGFAPAQFKATGKHNVYVVAVRDPNTEVKIAGTGEDEVGIPHAISTDDILHVHVGKAYASHPGSHTITKDWGGNYSDGSSFQPSTYVGWKKMRFEEL